MLREVFLIAVCVFCIALIILAISGALTPQQPQEKKPTANIVKSLVNKEVENPLMIAFCITCKGRAQHIEKTLPKNLADNTGNSKFILLNYNSPDHLLDYLVTNHKDAMKSGKLVLYTYAALGQFQMAHAKNMAHRLGIREGADVLVNLDADNYAGPHFDEYAAKQFREPGIFMCARMIKSGPGRLARGIAGRLVCTPRAFINAGGYDERYTTWAPEDIDFNARLRRMGWKAREIEPVYLDAEKHNDKVRFREYPEARKYLEGDQVATVNSSTETVVNNGRFGIGTVCKNFDPTPIDLGEMPTRIFGIGMHKTATTSLHKAFGLLGYDSWHWNSGSSARLIYDEMNATGKSKTLESFYALSDLPITVLYEKLDKSYPNSKFVLTVRDEGDWLESIRKHFSYKYNTSRWEWDVYPFADRIHQRVYGRKTFDAETFLARYRQHNADVQAYFKYRPSDLLVMNMSMDSNACWGSLCQFLNKPVPAVRYPRAYVTA